VDGSGTPAVVDRGPGADAGKGVEQLADLGLGQGDGSAKRWTAEDIAIMEEE
jgi:hypothetical protein